MILHLLCITHLNNGDNCFVLLMHNTEGIGGVLVGELCG